MNPPSTEETPLLRPPQRSPTGLAKSYSHNDVALNRGGGGGPRPSRPQSVPVLSDRAMHEIIVSPLFIDKFFMAKGGTILTSSFNLASATLGAGVLALPRAMEQLGTLAGTLTLAVICAMTVYSCFLLVSVGELLELNSFEALAGALLGRWCERLVAVVIVVFCWGVAVMYVVVMGDFISPFIDIFGLQGVVTKHAAMVVFWALVMLPLSMARQINSLRYASCVGCVATVVLAATLVIKVGAHGVASPPPPLAQWGPNSRAALSTFVFSYCCQPVVFKVFDELQSASVGRLTFSATLSMCCCTLIYIVTGIFGALAFGASTSGNVLNNFAAHLDLPYVQLAYAGMSVTVTMAFPMTIFPTRESVVLFLGYGDPDAPPWVHRAIGAALAALALLAGLCVPSITALFDLLGGICGGSLSLFLPGLFALRCGFWEPSDVGMVHHLAAWAVTVFGAVMCVVGTYNSIANQFFDTAAAAPSARPPGGNSSA